MPSAKAPCAVVVAPAASVKSRAIGIAGLMMSTRNPSAISVNMPSMMPFGMSRFGSADSSGREWKLLDGEKQPHRKGQRSEDAMDAEGQERPIAVRQLDGRSRRRVCTDIHRVLAEIDERDRAHEEDEQHRDREQGDDDGDGERQFDASCVEPDKDDVADDPPDRLETRQASQKSPSGSCR